MSCGGHFQGFLPERNAHDTVERREHQDDAGTFGSGSSRPRRKMTPRSYSARILIELKGIKRR